METRDVSALLGQLDLAFVIDATGSMGMYIEEARRHARDVAADFAKSADLDIRCAVVFYRDHPPQDASFVTDVRPFGPMNGLVLKLRQDANGGGDTPEAVWDGVFAAANDLVWRPNADKRIFLIGDSPPHGVGYTGPHARAGGTVGASDVGIDAMSGLLTLGDGFPDGCPCGLSGGGLSELLVSKGIVLHAHSIVGMKETTDAFRALAEATGGECTVVDHPEAAMMAYAATLRDTSGTISDARVYSAALATDPSETWSLSRAKETLGWSAARVARTAEYLAGRGYEAGLRTDAVPEDFPKNERGRDG